MLAFLRTLHVLSLAVWLGSVVFFTLAGLLIFRAFEEESLKTDRELWFPIPAQLQKDPPGKGFPDPLRLEQGSRAAGVAVGGVFPVYFALQAGCAVVAVLTALALARGRGGMLNTARVVICVLGLATVLGGWWLERRVHDLREPRNFLTDAVLREANPSAEQVEQARQARVAFGTWHGISLLDNFATLGLALLATLLAAHLPSAEPPRPPKDSQQR